MLLLYYADASETLLCFHNYFPWVQPPLTTRFSDISFLFRQTPHCSNFSEIWKRGFVPHSVILIHFCLGGGGSSRILFLHDVLILTYQITSNTLYSYSRGPAIVWVCAKPKYPHYSGHPHYMILGLNSAGRRTIEVLWNRE